MSAVHVLRVDGGARGNPGPAAAGFVLESPGGGVLARGGRCIGVSTNNVAEYEALVWGLETALERGVREVEVLADSELVVKQVNGVYKVKHANMKPLHARVTALLGRFERWRVGHVAREMNTAADALVNEALDSGGTVGDAPWPGAAPATLF